MSRRPCAAISAAHDEPLHARAGRTRAWVLVEQPGPWGQDPLADGRLDRHLAHRLASAAEDPHLRVALIRRHGRYSPTGHHCFLAWSGPDRTWIEQRVVEDPTELLEVDLSALAAGQRTGFGALFTEPLFLVCTHGSKDACCAQFGRPAAAALSAARPARTWESTHVGGDRFAPNLVCLPHGMYFGRVGPDEVVEVADRYAAGEITLPHYRGRSCLAIPAQAADWHVRRLEGILAIDGLTPEDPATPRPAWFPPSAGDVDEVVLVSDRHRYWVSVRLEPSREPRMKGCGDTSRWRPGHYTLIDLLREDRRELVAAAPGSTSGATTGAPPAPPSPPSGA